MDFATDFSTIPPSGRGTYEGSVENSQIDPASMPSTTSSAVCVDGKGVLTGPETLQSGATRSSTASTEIDGILATADTM